MKLKIIFISSFIIICICACQSSELKNIKIKETKIATETTTLTTKVIDTTNKTTVNTTKKNQTTTKKTNNLQNQVVIEETTQTNDDTIDESHPDYTIHKGRIDCQDESTCMDLSLPIQFKYKNNISNTFYTEVVSQNNKVLGYFIEYVFKEYEYADMDECNKVGNEITEELSDRILNFDCQNNGTLKINPDY